MLAHTHSTRRGHLPLLTHTYPSLPKTTAHERQSNNIRYLLPRGRPLDPGSLQSKVWLATALKPWYEQ
jgi:hypothetical protein